MKNVLVMGEVLIDFIPVEKGKRLKDVDQFHRAAGGAPANVAAAVAKLGGSSYLFSQVGADPFGTYLRETLQSIGVHVDTLTTSPNHPTALAFVSLDSSGNRDFAFVRHQCADLMYSPDQLNSQLFTSQAMFHFGSVDLIESPMKNAHIQAIQWAHQHHMFVSFDPNVRLALWANHDNYRQTIQEFIPFATLLKVSDDELPFITQMSDEAQAIHSLFRGRIQVVVVTRGSQGISLYTPTHQIHLPAAPARVVDTTGAGDSVMGAILYQLSLRSLESITMDDWWNILDFARTTAACVVEKPGAIPALPSLQEVLQRMKK